MVKNMAIQIGDWKGTIDFLSVPLDDFDFILGNNFFQRAKVALLPHLNGLLIMDKKKPCFVVGISNSPKRPSREKTLSALRLEKGLRKGEHTYVMALIEIKKDKYVEGPDAIAPILSRFADVMPLELPKKLSSRRQKDQQIELMLGSRTPAQVPYRMNPPELTELRKQLTEFLDAGLVQPSKAPYEAPVLFQKKQDGTLRMCVDYRALNKVTIKNKYLIPLAAELFDGLSKAEYLTKLDLRLGYWQVRVAEGDEAKATCVTLYGSFKFLVMPFGLTNAPETFCNLMNDFLFEFLDSFVVVYLDNIVIYSPTIEDFLVHLEKVFDRLRLNQLYVKK